MLSLVYMPTRKTSFRWPYGIGNVLTLFPSSKQFGLPRPPRGSPPPLFLTSKRLPLPRGTRQEEAYGMDFRLQIDMPNFGGQNMQKKYNSQLVPFARQLRSEMTKEERHLWYDFLRTYPIRFSRQKVLGKYIADFYSGTYACTARFGVGVDAYIDPADCTVFYGNLRRIRNFQAGRCRHRPLQSTARIHGCSSGRQRRPPLRQPRKPYTK